MISIKRVFSAAVVLLIAFITALIAPLFIYISVVSLVALLAFIEFLHMYHVNNNKGLYFVSITIFIFLCISCFFPNTRNSGLGLTIASLTIMALGLATQKIGGKHFEQLASCIVGTVYIAPLLYYLVLMRLGPEGSGFIILLGIGTGIRDLGSMLSGRVLRPGHTMLPMVSPRKTYEGAFGGLLFTLIAVIIASRWLIPTWNIYDAIAISLLIGTFGQVGDLVESWFKRNANAINSSNILPGQGGILDSFDSLIFTAPVLYFYVLLRT